MGILASEIIVILLVAVLYFFWDKRSTLLDRIINAALVAQTLAMPLIFTSITRSVFEVSKLLAMRLVLITITAAWLTKLIIRQQPGLLFGETRSLPDQKIFRLGKAQWLRTGLEWPLLAWVIMNLISTFLSPCWPIPLIGAYDRWESINLVLNYVLLFYFFTKLPQKKALFTWLFGGLLGSALFSAVYGIFQSRGLDFMRWSVDPTSRVFASINNPVHYSAYLAMLVPLGIGLILMLATNKKTDLSIKNPFNDLRAYFQNIWKNKKFLPISTLTTETLIELKIYGLLLITMIMFYSANFLSFGRATWIGFTIAISLLYMLLPNLLNAKSPRNEFWDFVAYIAALAMWNFVIIFKVQYLKPVLFWPTWVLLIVVILLNYLTSANWRHFAAKALVIIGCGNLQFVVADLKAVVIFTLCLWGYAKLNADSFQSKNIFKLSVLSLALFGLILLVPSLNVLWTIEKNNLNNYLASAREKTATPATTSTDISTALQQNATKVYQAASKMQEEKIFSQTEFNVISKSQGYTSALHGTGSARMSMWKTGLVWARTYPFFGTGPGTIKEMYPTFRRADYGRLEGGQNYTPDRLHNDYIDCMATNGFLGFAVYFLWFLPTFLWLSFKRITINSKTNTPSNYLIIGLLCGIFVYWGQTFFNFGVVATKSLHYMLMGLCLAIVLNNPWRDFPDTLPESKTANGQ